MPEEASGTRVFGEELFDDTSDLGVTRAFAVEKGLPLRRINRQRGFK